MTLSIRDGIYLEDNPPTRNQFRVGRREQPRSVVVLHTAESGTDLHGADPKAENVAAFIQQRKDAGSYQLIGDADSIIQLVRFENEAFQDGTGSNRWAIGISLAMNAQDWEPGRISDHRRHALARTAAVMAVMAANWLRSQGLPAPAPVHLTEAESDAPGASGFIAHARRDPERRTDPGDFFPWALFFNLYSQYLTEGLPALTTIKETTAMANQHVIEWQKAIGVAADGDFGPKTLEASENLLDHNKHLSELANRNVVDPALAEKAALFDQLGGIVRKLNQG